MQYVQESYELKGKAYDRAYLWRITLQKLQALCQTSSRMLHAKEKTQPTIRKTDVL